MSYKFSGTASEDCSVYVINTSDDSIEKVESVSAGPYEIDGLTQQDIHVMAIPVSDKSGVVYQDVTAIYYFGFEGFTGDDFTGTNGDLPNSDVWYVNHEGVTMQQFEIQNNNLQMEAITGDGGTDMWGLIRGKFVVNGDFDLRWHWTRINFPWQYDGAWWFDNFLWFDADNYLQERRRISYNDHYYTFSGKAGGIAFGSSNIGNYIDQRIKVVRSGTTISSFYGSSYQNPITGGGASGFSTGPVWFMHRVYGNPGNAMASGNLQYTLNHFTIVQGSPSSV